MNGPALHGDATRAPREDVAAHPGHLRESHAGHNLVQTHPSNSGGPLDPELPLPLLPDSFLTLSREGGRAAAGLPPTLPDSTVPKLPLASTLSQFCHVFLWSCPHPKPLYVHPCPLSTQETLHLCLGSQHSLSPVRAGSQEAERILQCRQNPGGRASGPSAFQAWPGAQCTPLPDSGKLVEGAAGVGPGWRDKGATRGCSPAPCWQSGSGCAPAQGLQGGILLALAHEVQVGTDGVRVVQPTAALGVGLFREAGSRSCCCSGDKRTAAGLNHAPCCSGLSTGFPEEGGLLPPPPRASAFPAGTEPACASWPRPPPPAWGGCSSHTDASPHPPASRGGAGPGSTACPEKAARPFLPSISLLLGRPGGSGGMGARLPTPIRNEGADGGEGRPASRRL